MSDGSKSFLKGDARAKLKEATHIKTTSNAKLTEKLDQYGSLSSNTSNSSSGGAAGSSNSSGDKKEGG